MFISVYMVLAARLLYALLVVIFLLGLSIALALSRNFDPAGLDQARSFVAYALHDGLKNNEGGGVATAALVIGFSAVVIGIFVKTATRLWSDWQFLRTPFATVVRERRMPKAFIATLILMLVIFPCYLFGVLKQNHFPSTGLFGYFATFFIYAFALFMIMGDLYFAYVIKFRRPEASERS